MLNRRGFYLTALALIGGLAFVLGLLVLLPRCGTGPAPTTTQTDDSASTPPASTAAADIMAMVDGDPIMHAEWRQVTAMDRVMSQLAGQPLPDAESTLGRLINERLVLRLAAQEKITASDAQARERLASLQQNWHADDATVDRALASANLSRQDLMAEIKRLLVVEAYLKQVSATQDPAAWLAAQRSRAKIGVYADLAAPAPRGPSALAQVATPTVVAWPVQAIQGQAATSTPTSAPKVAPTQTVPIGSAPGQLAPDFSLDDATGRPVKLGDVQGHPVIVNFWASWCQPCRQEVPVLQSAYKRYRDQGIVLLGVNLKESADTVQQFASQVGLTYPVLFDRDGVVSERYQVRGIPTTVFLDAEGVVRARHVGPLTEDQLAQYLAPLAASPSPIPTVTMPPAAKMAPDFSLPRENNQIVRLSDYRDKSSVVLVFYRGQT